MLNGMLFLYRNSPERTIKDIAFVQPFISEIPHLFCTSSSNKHVLEMK